MFESLYGDIGLGIRVKTILSFDPNLDRGQVFEWALVYGNNYVI